MSNWTQGPWIVGTHQFDNDGYVESIIKQIDGPVYVGVAVTTGPVETDQREANARLMASAPCLAEALKSALSYIDWIHHGSANGASPVFDKAKARAALQRAEGEL